MQKEYKKPEIFSEKLAIETLRAACCPTETLYEEGYSARWNCEIGKPCLCLEPGGPS